MYITAVRMDTQTVQKYLVPHSQECQNNGVNWQHTTPVFVNITLHQCPQGFALAVGLYPIPYYQWNRIFHMEQYSVGEYNQSWITLQHPSSI